MWFNAAFPQWAEMELMLVKHALGTEATNKRDFDTKSDIPTYWHIHFRCAWTDGEMNEEGSGSKDSSLKTYPHASIFGCWAEEVSQQQSLFCFQ